MAANAVANLDAEEPSIAALELDPDHESAVPDLADAREPGDAAKRGLDLGDPGLRVSSCSNRSDSMPTAQASGLAVYVWPWKKCFISAWVPRNAE